MKSNSSGHLAVQLGAELKRFRLDAGLSTRSVADAMGTGQARVSKIENGRLQASAQYIQEISQLLHLNDQQVRRLEFLQHITSDPLCLYFNPEIGRADSLNKFIYEIEYGSKSFISWSSATVDGLLQSKDFTRYLAETVYRLPPASVTAFCEARLNRQQLLNDQSRYFQFVISSWCISESVVPTRLMERQLNHLVHCAKKPNVSVQIIEPGRTLPCIPESSFCVLDQELVLVELRDQVLPVWNKEQVEGYINDFHDLQSAASAVTAVSQV